MTVNLSILHHQNNSTVSTKISTFIDRKISKNNYWYILNSICPIYTWSWKISLQQKIGDIFLGIAQLKGNEQDVWLDLHSEVGKDKKKSSSTRWMVNLKPI